MIAKLLEMHFQIPVC